MDYQTNSNKSKEPKPDKNLERVVHTEVLVQRKGIGRKFKDLFIQTDPRSVVQYVFYEVVIPQILNMIVDSGQRGLDKMFRGDARNTQGPYGMFGGGPRTTYNNPVVRGYGNAALRPPPGARQRSVRSSQENLIFSSSAEAASVIELMNDVIEQYEFATVADLNKLVGIQSQYTDNNWGWEYFGDAQVRNVREGFLLEVPPAQPISR